MPEPLKMMYEKDAPMDALKGKTVAILGYGSQGHAHAQNLRDSGVKVIVANRKDSANGRLATEHGFQLQSVEDAVKAADLIVVTLPDEVQPEVYNKSIAPHLKAGKALGTTHGFNVHFKTIVPPKDVDVLLVAPKALAISFALNLKKAAASPASSPFTKTPPEKRATSASPGRAASAALDPASSKPPSKMNAKPISSANKPSSAEA